MTKGASSGLSSPIVQATGEIMNGTLTTFAQDPRQTRTGFNAMNSTTQRLGDSIIHNSPIGKHSFLATPMIDNAPAETGGVGLHFEFRQRDKSKEI